jgi:hypothetical protein
MLPQVKEMLADTQQKLERQKEVSPIELLRECGIAVTLISEL